MSQFIVVLLVLLTLLIFLCLDTLDSFFSFGSLDNFRGLVWHHHSLKISFGLREHTVMPHYRTIILLLYYNTMGFRIETLFNQSFYLALIPNISTKTFQLFINNSAFSCLNVSDHSLLQAEHFETKTNTMNKNCFISRFFRSFDYNE